RPYVPGNGPRIWLIRCSASPSGANPARSYLVLSLENNDGAKGPEHGEYAPTRPRLPLRDPIRCRAVHASTL
ncbi:hypothetical protein VU13_00280, partial [Desulfobulbus sp. US5]|nr:hypothetical protein [Desulfobulbus sp. US5]